MTVKVFHILMDGDSVMGDGYRFKNIKELEDHLEYHSPYYWKRDFTFRFQFHNTLTHKPELKSFCIYLLSKFKNVIICKY